MDKKLFVFFNGEKPSDDPFRLLGQGETEEEAKDHLARTLGFSSYRDFQTHVEKKMFRFLKKEKVAEIRSFD